MARVQLIDPATMMAEHGELIERIRAGRLGVFLNLYRMLMNAPALAASWFTHMGAVRWETGLDGRLRELVIIRIAYLTDAAYVIRQHVPKLAIADGVSAAECEALTDWTTSDFFTPRERAVLAYADAMTRDIKVPDAVFAPVQDWFNDKALVELTVLVGAYNMHVRVMQALDVDLEPAG